MDISCDIIRDLLPLYAEELVSSDSRKLVDDHLCICDLCTKQLGILKKAAVLPIEVETKSLKRVKHTLRRRRLLTVAAVLLTVAALIVTVMTFLLTPYHLTAEEAIEGVQLREDGGLAIDYARGINGMSGQAVFDTDNYGIVCHTNRYDWYRAKQKNKITEGMSQEELKAYIAERNGVEECTQRDWDNFHNIQVEYGTWEDENGQRFHYPHLHGDSNSKWKQVWDPADRNYWYIDAKTGEEELLLWDGGKDMPTSVIMLTTYAYGYIFWGCLIAVVLCYLIARGINGIWKEILGRVPMILACTAVSVILVTGGKLTTLQYNLSSQWNAFIYVEALLLSLTALCWHQLHLMNKQNRGM